MKEVDKNPEISGKKLTTFKKGFDPKRNLEGRPKGSGYKQKFEKMLTKVAEEKGITKEEAELELFKTAYEQALKGNYQFFKDYVDRAYGPVKHDATLNVENLEKLVIVAGNKDDYQE